MLTSLINRVASRSGKFSEGVKINVNRHLSNNRCSDFHHLKTHNFNCEFNFVCVDIWALYELNDLLILYKTLFYSNVVPLIVGY